MASAYLNTIVTAVPDFDVHDKFIQYGPTLLSDKRAEKLFHRMAGRAQIDHRYSFLRPHADPDKLDADNFYGTDGYRNPANEGSGHASWGKEGNLTESRVQNESSHGNSSFPDTRKRMQFYERQAFPLARRALDQLDVAATTHLIITTCTGFYAPGIDQQIVRHYGLSPAVERTMVGFMGCYAALNALKLARHIVRSESNARVLVVNLELCTLHLKPGGTLEEILSFMIFADGCAASIVSAQPTGMELQSFSTTVIPETKDLITWRIGELGFDMNLSGKVPSTIASALPSRLEAMLDGCTPADIAHWAIHPGGRTVLDAVREGAGLDEHQLRASREVLRCFGNMSSATIMFVLHHILTGSPATGAGCAMAFGPGLTVESMRFMI